MDPSSQNGTSSLHPSNAHRPAAHEDTSTASIKSGVIGFAQGRDDPSHIQSGRSFPLAGGVTNQQTPQTTTSEREPGTKEREVGLHDGQDRDTIAEGATPVNPPGQAPQSTNPEALAAATAAPSTAHDGYGWNHHHSGRGHAFRGDPCETEEQSKSQRSQGNGLLFTTGPHSTDIANILDPKLHIPGAYPTPTPLDESSAPSYLQSKSEKETSSPAAAEPQQLRHTGSLDEPRPRSAETPEHHYGRDAAIAGGRGAAGAGAYAAGRGPEGQLTHADQETFTSKSDLYTSTRVDPRVDTVPRSDFTEQRYDPTLSAKHNTRNFPLTGGAIGSSDISTQSAPMGRGVENKEYPAAVEDVKSDSQHRYGRDAALVGAGAATTAGLYASQREAEPDSGPASSTIGPHKSNVANVLDPRVQPDPNLQKHHHAAPTVEDPAPSTVGPHTSDAANILDPRVLPDPQKQKAAPPMRQHDSNTPKYSGSNVPESELSSEQHRSGRDAKVAGGAGAAGYGAYEVAKSYGEHRSTQPSASMNDQRYDPSKGAHDPRVIGTQHRTTSHTQDQQHQYGRDAAMAGGAGALGAGAYAATREHDQAQQPSPSQGYQQPSTAQRNGQLESGPHRRYDSTQEPQNDHSKRNAALGTTAAAGAGAGGAYAYSQHDAQQEHEQQVKEQQKAFRDQQKALERQRAKDQKHHDKLVAAEEKKHQKEAEHREHEHAKQLEKQQEREQREREKQLEKQQEREQREREKQQREHEHAKQLEKQQEREQREREKQQREHETLLAAEQQRRSKEEAERRPSDEEAGDSPKEKKHRFLTFLNKDKEKSSPEGSPRDSRDSARRSRDSEGDEGKPHLGEKHGRHVLHKDPPKGHPAREAMKHPESGGTREHRGTDGLVGGGSSADRYHAGNQHHTVTEPHTGLPMDVERHGDGKGGTDASNTIRGHHEVPGQAGQAGGATDWDAVRKADTAY